MYYTQGELLESLRLRYEWLRNASRMVSRRPDLYPPDSAAVQDMLKLACVGLDYAFKEAASGVAQTAALCREAAATIVDVSDERRLLVRVRDMEDDIQTAGQSLPEAKRICVAAGYSPD